MGLFGIVMNAALLLLIAWIASIAKFDFTSAASPRTSTADAIVAAVIVGRSIGLVGSRGQHGGPRLSDAGAGPDPLDAIGPLLIAAARRFGTPVFVTDLATLDKACGAVAAAFPDPWVRQFSVKANDVPAVIAAIGARGFGANVVSRGEWAVARRAGVPNERITLEGIGKTPADLRAAVARGRRRRRPLRWVALESPEEAEVWPRSPVRRGRHAPPSTCSTGSTRMSCPRRSPGWRSGPAARSSG